jgi:phenylpyruvate tautomerase PptA (4-oxalocrotonate tautomerase family)
MPIEIKELYIRINVDEGAKNGNSTESSNSSLESKEEIIAECVDVVMEILKEQKER